MLRLFKKTLAVCLIGFGFRSLACNITSIFRLVIYYWYYNSTSRNNLAMLLKKVHCCSVLKQRRGLKMTIVVKKVPKVLRGLVKLIFGVK